MAEPIALVESAGGDMSARVEPSPGLNDIRDGDTSDDLAERRYLMRRRDRLRRHVRAHAKGAFLGGISASAVVAGFLDAADVSWSLLAYVVLAAGIAVIILCGQALTNPRYRYRWLALGRRKGRPVSTKAGHLPLMASTERAPVRQIEAARCPDRVYGGGLRAICGLSEPLIVIASNRRDVSKSNELLFPLFADGQHHRYVTIDESVAGIPIRACTFGREWPDGGQDSEHTLAIKDLVYLPELAAALKDAGATNSPPLVLPEHCVDPQLLAERDVIIVGGADTNFWHAALFEAIVQELETPKSSVPLALDLRDVSGTFPVYGSRVLTARLAGIESLFPHTGDDQLELDERLFPTYGMVLACRNPYAAAINQSRWCVFVAGTRSLGTSGGVLGLSMMLNGMLSDPTLNFFSQIPTVSPEVRACVSAVLYRTTEVEQSVLRRSDRMLPRERRQLPSEGLDPDYSDTYVPTAVEYLSYDAGVPQWQLLGRIAD